MKVGCSGVEIHQMTGNFIRVLLSMQLKSEKQGRPGNEASSNSDFVHYPVHIQLTQLCVTLLSALLVDVNTIWGDKMLVTPPPICDFFVNIIRVVGGDGGLVSILVHLVCVLKQDHNVLSGHYSIM